MESLPEQAPVVDWEKVEGDIFCPLCDYNLRGLTDPRCPECGYRFEWMDLIDPQRRRHPYLFEHHPKRKVWSFFKTAWGGLRPRRFWKSLHPAQPSHARRLMLYWVLANSVLLLLPLLAVVAAGIDLTHYSQATRRTMIAQYSTSAGQAALIRDFGSRAGLDQFLDKYHPMPPSAAFFKDLSGYLGLGPTGNAWVFAGIPRSAPIDLTVIMVVSLLAVSWPWLTFLTLMIFQTSMARARVRVVHVLRCVVYGSDLVFWMVWVALAGILLCVPLMMQPSADRAFFLGMLTLLLGLAYVVLFIYRLTVAYARYLKFDHCLATVLASQVIVVLLIPTVLLVVARMVE